MAIFCKGVNRWMVLVTAAAFFVAVPPEWLDRGPNICLWRHLLHVAACPACGTTRALAAFFHGHFVQALVYNRNVLVTGPLLVGLLLYDGVEAATRNWRLRTAPQA